MLKDQIAAFYYAMSIPYFQYYAMYSRDMPIDETKVKLLGGSSPEEIEFIKNVNKLVVENQAKYNIHEMNEDVTRLVDASVAL